MSMFSANGVSDWLIQRISAIIIAQYTFFLLFFIFFTPNLDFAGWVGLFSSAFMRIATLVVVLALAAHAWIGLWTVGTDYIKPAAVRLAYQTLVVLLLVALCIWAVQIVWRL